MAAIAEQEAEWVPQRQEEVKKIKDEVREADSWSGSVQIKKVN